MKFKIKKADRPKHTELVACVGWTNITENGGELYSVGDDSAIWKWDINGEPVSQNFIFLFSYCFSIYRNPNSWILMHLSFAVIGSQ